MHNYNMNCYKFIKVKCYIINNLLKIRLLCEDIMKNGMIKNEGGIDDIDISE
jgi:hypothetical protein